MGKLTKLLENNQDKALSFENFYNEIKDRERRSTNIMVYNVEESSHQDVSATINQVSKIFHIMNINEDHISKVIRIGQVKKDSKRPIKIILKERNQVSLVLRNKHKLKGKINCVIDTDKTNLERSVYKKVHVKFKKRLEDGENNIKIRYIKGIPKILGRYVKKRQPACIIHTNIQGLINKLDQVKLFIQNNKHDIAVL